jgi:hypothetical protein
MPCCKLLHSLSSKHARTSQGPNTFFTICFISGTTLCLNFSKEILDFRGHTRCLFAIKFLVRRLHRKRTLNSGDKNNLIVHKTDNYASLQNGAGRKYNSRLRVSSQWTGIHAKLSSREHDRTRPIWWTELLLGYTARILPMVLL